MDIAIMLLLMTLGFVLIIKGGDIFVSSSVSIARLLHVSEMIIGVTIVSIGTTLPELLTSFIATLRGVHMDSGDVYFDLALSNAVGSMLANSGLILSIVLLIRPPKYDSKTFNKSSIYVLLISVLLCIFVVTDDTLSTCEGIALLSCFVIFMLSSIMTARRESSIRMQDVTICQDNIHDDKKTKCKRYTYLLLSFVVGALCIAIGAMLLVDNAKNFALRIGVSTQIVGVTIVAIGTSLPELVTSMTALRHGNADIGVGNILGAHVINATLIIGIISTMHSIPVDIITKNVAIWTLLAIMCVLILPTLILKKMTRLQGFIMLTMYLSYIIYNVTC